MFIGHYGVGLAAKRLAPRTSLGWFIAGATLLDLLFAVCMTLGLEGGRLGPAETPFLNLRLDHVPWSHSLLLTGAWSLAFAVLCWVVTRDRAAALVAAAAVASHWVLDFVTHRPDLPVWPDGPRVGLGLWYSTAGTLIVEGAIFLAGVAIYAAATRPRDRTGSWALWSYVLFLALVYAVNVAAPPPSTMTASTPAAGIPGVVLGCLLVLVAWFLDRHRAAAGAGERRPQAQSDARFPSTAQQ